MQKIKINKQTNKIGGKMRDRLNLLNLLLEEVTETNGSGGGTQQPEVKPEPAPEIKTGGGDNEEYTKTIMQLKEEREKLEKELEDFKNQGKTPSQVAEEEKLKLQKQREAFEKEKREYRIEILNKYKESYIKEIDVNELFTRGIEITEKTTEAELKQALDEAKAQENKYIEEKGLQTQQANPVIWNSKKDTKSKSLFHDLLKDKQGGNE